MILPVSLGQMRVLPARPAENLETVRAFATEASRRDSRLLCLPEACLTGFPWTWLRAHGGELEAPVEEMRRIARSADLFLSFSHMLPDGEGRLANTHLLLTPGGETLAQYRKVHLFSLFGEERHVAPGRRRVVAQAPWGPTGLAVCYDIRFPELFRACALEGAVLFLCPAAFPYPRREPWRVLARARAVENQAFFLGCNAVGLEGDGGDAVTYFGSSVAAGPLGEILAEADETSETLLSAELDFGRVESARGSIRVFEDRRPDVYGPA